jgi:hypothetical protein
MKKIFTSILLICIAINVHAQLAGKIFQGTLKPGSAPNSVKVVIKPSATFAGNFSNVQFTLQASNALGSQPAVSIKNNLLSTYIPTANYLTQVTNEGGYFTYLFAAVIVGSPQMNFVSGTELEMLEIQFAGDASNGNIEVRLASLPGGGTTGQSNFYIEVNGNDNTNYSSMFYQSGSSGVPVNGGSYSSYSYVPYSQIVLPLLITQFDVTRSGLNAIVKWVTENQSTNNSHFEIERSDNATAFATIGTVLVSYNGSSLQSYSYVDKNLAKSNHSSYIYYRLKQVDKDGQFAYSGIRKIKALTEVLNLGILSNPVRSRTLNLTIDAPTVGKGTLMIYNNDGKKVHSTIVGWAEGYTEHEVFLPVLPPGYYVACLFNGDQQYQVTFIK